MLSAAQQIDDIHQVCILNTVSKAIIINSSNNNASASVLTLCPLTSLLPLPEA